MLTSTGNFSYRAPELIKNISYNENIDLWSVGVVLYECFTGVHPFISKYKKDTADNIINKRPDFWKMFSNKDNSSAINLLKQLLNKDGTKRISASHALKHNWFKLGNLKMKFRLSIYHQASAKLPSGKNFKSHRKQMA